MKPTGYLCFVIEKLWGLRAQIVGRASENRLRVKLLESRGPHKAGQLLTIYDNQFRYEGRRTGH